MEDTLQSPSAEGAVIPKYAEEALMKALAVKDKDRYETTYDFRNAVLEGKWREAEQASSTDPSMPGTFVPDENSPEDVKVKKEKMLEYSFRETLEKAAQGNIADRAKMDILSSKERDSAAADVPSVDRKGQEENISEDISRKSPDLNRADDAKQSITDDRNSDQKVVRNIKGPGKSSTTGHTQLGTESDKNVAGKKGSRMKILSAAVGKPP